MTAGRGCRVGLLLLALLALDVTPSIPQRHPADFRGRVLCIQELVRTRPIAPIPVGCEIVDCCPGCPADVPIDWRIGLAADAGVSLRLEFENLPEAVRRQLRIAGTARWVDGRRLDITPGEAFIRRFPRTFAGRPPVARASVIVQTAGLATADRRRIDITLQQFIGPVLVNELHVRRDLVNCRAVSPGPDIVRLKNNATQDNAVILLDAQRAPTGPCQTADPIYRGNDEVWRGAGDVNVGNVLAPRSCNSEVLVFSQNSAMQWLENVTAWTDATGDRVDVNLAPRWPVPVTIWVVRGPFTTTMGDGMGDHAAANVARASELYGSMNCGLTVHGTITDATANPQAPGQLRRRCSDGAGLRAAIGFTADRVNVYYIAEALKEGEETVVRGAACGLVLPSPTADDRNTLLVSADHMDGESLAHELGHALSLRDRNTSATPGAPNYLPTTNVMSGGGIDRDSLTEGQCFRVNAGPLSALNRNGIRVGPTRACDDPIASATCPALSLDPDPNN